MATASDLAVLRGLSTYKARGEAWLGHAYSVYVGRPRKNARSEAVAIVYEIVFWKHWALLTAKSRKFFHDIQLPGIFYLFIFFWFCRTWTKRYLITSQTRVKRVSRIHHRMDEDGPVVYPANAFDSRLRGD